MKKDRAPVAVYVTSLLLTAYCIAVLLQAPFTLTAGFFLLLPFCMIWVVLSILRTKTGEERELAAGEEWGYADRPEQRPMDY